MSRKITISLVQSHVVEILECGSPVLWHKIALALLPLSKPLLSFLCPIAVFLKIKWPAAYYFMGAKLLNERRSMESHVDVDRVLIEEIENRVITYLQKAIDLKPSWSLPYYTLYTVLHSTFKLNDQLEIMYKIVELENNRAKARQLDKLDIEFIAPDVAIGSIGVYSVLDTYIKAGILGLRPPKKLVLLLSPRTVINNPCYLNYWRRYVTVISDPLTIRNLSPLEKYLTKKIFHFVSFHDRILNIVAAHKVVNRQWDVENRPPVLTLSTEDYENGWDCLKSLGVPEGAWFVCLHVRGSGWRDDGSSSENFRNCDIETYFSAIKTIVEAGGWVVRIGDPISMTPLPPMENVIDYAHSDVKSDWMDIFCCAQCRFIIGTASGMWPVSSAFGVPLIMTNMLPTNLAFDFSSKDIFIPRLCWSIKENRYLAFRELLSFPVAVATSQFSYDRLGLKIEENTEEDINVAVTEMMKRLDKTLEYSNEDEIRQERFRSQTTSSFYGEKAISVNARIGKDFLCKNKHLLAG
jgi:putative glycosyltransferase (TIGR04372 family)